MIQLNDNILSQSPKMLDAKFGPFNSITEALTFLTPSIRELGALSIVKVAGQATLYWFRNGVSDSDYIPFSMGGNASIQQYPDFISFPTIGQSDVIYIDLSTNTSYYWDGTQYQSSTGGVEQYPNLSTFPLIGDPNIVYIAEDTSISYYWNGSSYHPTSSNVSNVVTLTTDQNNISGSKTFTGDVYLSNNNTFVQSEALKLYGINSGGPLTVRVLADNGAGTVVFDEVGYGNEKYVAYQDWASNPANIVEDVTHRFVTDTEKTTWNSKQNSLVFSTDIETDKLSTTKISAIKTFYDWSITKFQGLKTILTTFGNLVNANGWLKNDGSGNLSYSTPSKSDVGLGSVPNIDTTNATNISSGTLADARLSGNVNLLNTPQTIGAAKIENDGFTKVG